MFQNYLAAALRNLVRNRLYAAINIVGLAVGFTAALLIALFVRDEFSYDKWLPDHERTMLVSMTSSFATDVDDLDFVPPYVKQMIESEIPGVEKVVRLAGDSVSIRQGDIEFQEQIFSADPDLFDVLKLPLIAGDQASALQQPNSVIITRGVARKYFGTDDVLGKTIEFNRKDSMRITAVMEDFPSNTHMNFSIIESGVTASSRLSRISAFNPASGAVPPVAFTYAQLKKGASPETFSRAVVDLSERRQEFTQPTFKLRLYAAPIAAVHLRNTSPVKFERNFSQKPAGDPVTALGILLVGLLILMVANINFINLATETATRRAIEIGVRKISGAERRHLFWQFICEAVFYVAAAMTLALICANLILPSFNALLGRSISFGFNPLFIAGIAITVSGVGFAAGAYPAVVLSAFRPMRVLKGLKENPRKTGPRRFLVIAQFSVLIAVAVVVATVYAQLRYAMNESLRFDKDQVMEITTPCETAFTSEVRKLPGVTKSACSLFSVLKKFRPTKAMAPDGHIINPRMTIINFGYFELFGIEPLAGRLFSPYFGSDSAPADTESPGQPPVIINESLMRELGYATPFAAVGQSIRWQRQKPPSKADLNGMNFTDDRASEIIGVVPDFSKGTVQDATPPEIFWIDPRQNRILTVKLAKDNVPETVAAIDAAWKKFGDPRPITRTFLNQSVEDRYRDLTRQMLILASMALVTIFIAALGLFGLSALLAEQRTKEIGVRKAMGARNSDVLQLLLWQFTKPVLWANMVAWPTAYFLLKRWLQGFADHIALSPWIFIGTSMVAIVIAIVTVAGHALLVARAQPVTALRYE